MPTPLVNNVLKNNSLILSYKNIVTNGDFYNGINSWSKSNANLSTSDNTLVVTGDGTSAYFSAFNNGSTTPSVTGHILYVVAKLMVTNSVCSGFNLRLAGSTGGNTTIKFQATPTINTWYTMATTYTLTSGTTGNIYIRPENYYADATTANGKVLQIKQVMAIDLTARYGSGNEPSLAECNNIFKHVAVKRNNLVLALNTGT